MTPFLSEDFLLQSATARTLYHEFAEGMPIFDYHCHLPVEEIAADKRFANLTDVWLNGDHYKWRAMRANGVPERLITGDAPDREKFRAWAATVPRTLRNPLYHWTHLELKRYFGDLRDAARPGHRRRDLRRLFGHAADRRVQHAAHPAAHEREGGLHDRRPGRLARAPPPHPAGPLVPGDRRSLLPRGQGARGGRARGRSTRGWRAWRRPPGWRSRASTP